MLEALIGLAGSLGGRALMNQPPAGPAYAEGSKGPIAYKADSDFSGWTVATSGSKADGAQISKTTADALGVPSPTAAGALAALPPSALWVAGGLLGVAVLWRILKR